ncbi:MAG: PIN-like domain-containing protein, partial [Nitrosospira sp.]
EIQRLTNRVNLSPKVKEQFQELTKRSLNELRQKVETLRNAHTLGASRVEDPILTRLQLIFDRKVGSPLPTTEHSEAEKEAQRRIEAKVPPGYKDAEKSNPHGDYLVWAQALNEAQKRGVETTIFVTEDRKEDWYERVNGEIVGPRPELVEEAYSIANTRLQLMPIRSLFHHAAKHLNAKVSNETLLQAERLPERSRFRRTIAHTDGDKRLTQLDRQIHELYDEAKRIEHTLDVVRSASTSDPTDTQVAEHVAILTQNLARVVKRISHLKRRRDDLGEIMIRNFNAATHGFTQDPDTPMSSDSDTTMDEYRRMLRKRLEDMDTDYLE